MDRHRLNRLRDFVSYTAISLLLLAVLLIGARGNHWKSFFNWFQFAGFSSVLFGYLIAHSRQWWRRRAFWALIGFFLSAHTIAFAYVLTRVEKVKPIWFAMIVPVEMLGFIVLADWLLARSANRHVVTDRP